MTDPTLPEPELPDMPQPKWPAYGEKYNWMDMRAYATAAVLAERERCAKLCDALVMAIDGAGNPYRRPADAERCAAAIRAG